VGLGFATGCCPLVFVAGLFVDGDVVGFVLLLALFDRAIAFHASNHCWRLIASAGVREE
jgi:hypothetical protein